MADTLAGHGSMRFPSAGALAAWRRGTGGVLRDAARRLDRRADGEVFALDVDERAHEVRFAALLSSRALASEFGAGELATMANLLWTAAVQRAEGAFEFVALTGKPRGRRLTLAAGRAEQSPAKIVEDDLLAALAPYRRAEKAAKAPSRAKLGVRREPVDIRYHASARAQRVLVEIEVQPSRDDVGASFFVELLCSIVAHGAGGSDAFAPKVGAARTSWGDEPPDELRDAVDVSVELTLKGLAPSVLAAWCSAVLRRYRVKRLAVVGDEATDRTATSLTTARLHAIGKQRDAVVFVRHPSTKVRAVEVPLTAMTGTEGPLATLHGVRGDIEDAAWAVANAFQLLTGFGRTSFLVERSKHAYRIRCVTVDRRGRQVATRIDATQAKAVLENVASRLGPAIDRVEWHRVVANAPARRRPRQRQP